MTSFLYNQGTSIISERPAGGYTWLHSSLKQINHKNTIVTKGPTFSDYSQVLQVLHRPSWRSLDLWIFITFKFSLPYGSSSPEILGGASSVSWWDSTARLALLSFPYQLLPPPCNSSLQVSPSQVTNGERSLLSCWICRQIYIQARTNVQVRTLQHLKEILHGSLWAKQCRTSWNIQDNAWKTLTVALGSAQTRRRIQTSIQIGVNGVVPSKKCCVILYIIYCNTN